MRVGAGPLLRRTRSLAALLLLAAAAEGWLASRALARRAAAARAAAEGAAAVAALGLTDLAVWTEARYTRHPSLADRFAAFQDHPGAIEHFPAGAVVPPPPHLRPGGAGAP
jgi:O-antigen ligase